jgi:DNA polymerase-3 subunit beta
VKFSCTKDNLHQGLSIASHISGKSANLPILNNILLQADVGGVRLTSTNLDLTVSCMIRAKVDQPGGYTLPAKLLADYVGLLPDERIDLDLLDTSVAVHCGSSKTKMHGLAASEFPAIPKVSGGITYTVQAQSFDAALGQTLFAVSTSEARQILTGAFLYFNGDTKTVTVAATDSYRLGEKSVPLVSETLGERKVVIPARTLAELRRILSVLRSSVEAAENIDIELTDNQIAFRCGSVELSSRTIDGVYPDYRQIIPKTFTTELILERNALIQAVKRTALFSKNGLFDVRFEVRPEEKLLRLFANDIGRGENEVTIEAEVMGNANSITLNFRYLLDGAQALQTEKVHMKMIDAMNPCIILPHGQEKTDYLYIVMPIRQ